MKELERIVFKKIQKLSEYLCKQNKLKEKWENIMFDFVTKAI